MILLTVVGLVVVFIGCIAMFVAQEKATQVKTQEQYNTVIQELNNSKSVIFLGFGIMAVGLVLYGG